MSKARTKPMGRPPLPPGDGKTSHLHIRVEPQRKAGYVHAAKRSGLGKLAAWIVHHLDSAAADR